MIQYQQIIIGLALSLLAFTACYSSEEFPDNPDNLDAKIKNFESVSKLLEEINAKNENEAIRLTVHKDKRIRRAAALRLLTLGASSPDATRVLSNLLQNDTDARVRSAAARALSEVGGGRNADAVVRGICDANANVRLYSLKSLIRMEGRADEAIARHLASSKYSNMHCPTKTDDSYTLRDELLLQLEQHGAKFLSAISYSLAHADKGIVATALMLIKKQGRAASIALPHVTALLEKSTDEQIRFMCIDVLSIVGDQHPTVLPALFAAQNDSSPKIQTAAQNAIRRIQARNNRPQPSATGPRRGPAQRRPMPQMNR